MIRLQIFVTWNIPKLSKSELNCTDGVANIFLQGFDVLKEEIEEFGKKLGIGNGEKHHI